MRYGVLGPLEVRDGERPVEITSAKQRALLAVLLLNANRVISTDRLIDALWGESPPESATKLVQLYISQLRKLLGKERVETKPPGYRVLLTDDELDLEQFHRLAAEGRPREALALWRGPPLADFANEHFAQSEIARLEELRLGCLEDRIDADLRAGRHGELVAELEALVSEHPLRERLRGQLMLALYRSARQAEALDAYKDARRTLVEDLGIEPRRDLQELQRAILRQDVALDLAGGAGALDAKEADRGPFVGREAELEALRKGLDDALAGRGRLLLLAGEPGIGKSRLADELTRQARARGVRVLVGRCWEAGGAPVYWPWVQLLRAYIDEAEPEPLRVQLGAGAGELAHLLPELRELIPNLPQAPAAESEGARFRLFDATSSFLRRLADARPLLLVLDDLHAADEPSLLLLQFVARELGASRALVIGAYRDVDPTLADPLTTALTELAREPVTHTLELSGLEASDVARFIELVAEQAPVAELTEAVHAQTDGNPLFVGEIVRLLAAEGRLDEAPARRLVLPRGVRDVIARRLAHLSSECNRTLVLASVLGREFDVETLARLAAVPEDELLDPLDEAGTARVVTDVPGSPGQLRFAHVLIRDTLYEGLTGARRLRLHRAAVGALEGVYGDDPGPHLAELAHHAIVGSDFDKGLAYARRAGDRALGLLAYEEAARLYEVALDAADRTHTSDAVARCELLLSLGDAEMLAGEGPAARETFLLAAALARKTRSPEHLARAALGYTGRDLWAPRAEGEPNVVPLLQEALATCDGGDSVPRARLLARLASSLRGAVDRSRPKSLANAAVEMAGRIGDRTTLLYALGSRLVAARGPDNVAEGVADGLKVVRLAEELGDGDYAFSGHEDFLYQSWILGDRSAMATEVEAMTRLAHELRQPSKEWCVAAYHAISALSEGRFDVAEDLIERAFRIGERAESWIAVSSYRLQTFALRAQRGGLEGYDDVLRSSIDEYRGYRIFECALADAYSQLGREREAREAFEGIAADDFRELARDEDWLVNMCLLSDVCMHLGDTSRAATLYRLLSPFAAFNAFAQPEIALGSVAHSLGRLALMMRRFEEAATHFETACEMNARMGARPWLAHTQNDYASMLVARGGPGDRERAGELLETALATYRELGMQTYAERCTEETMRM